jgi:hypothetical protein
VEPEREELQACSVSLLLAIVLFTFLQLSEDESEFPATSAENSRFVEASWYLPHLS